jgi:polyferredoxin
MTSIFEKYKNISGNKIKFGTIKIEIKERIDYLCILCQFCLTFKDETAEKLNYLSRNIK